MKQFKVLIIVTYLLVSNSAIADPCATVQKSAATLVDGKCANVSLILAAAVGGGSDTIIRELSLVIKKLGINAIIENQSAVNGVVAASTVKRGNDCQFLVSSNSNLSLNALHPTHSKNFNFKDFKSISHISTSPFVLAYHKNAASSGHGFNDLTHVVQAGHGIKDFGSAGPGSLGEIMGTAFNQRTKNADVHIPYKGSSPAAADLAAGRISYLFESPSTIVAIKKAYPKQIEIIGSTSESTFDFGVPPDVISIPPLSKASPKLAGFNFYPYIGIFAKEKQPEAISKSFENIVSCALQNKEFRTKFEQRGFIVGSGTSAELQKAVQHWGPNTETGRTIKEVLNPSSKTPQSSPVVNPGSSGARS